jgi:hypothetical protein
MSKQEHAALRRRHVKAIRGNVIYLRPWPRKVRYVAPTPTSAA